MVTSPDWQQKKPRSLSFAEQSVQRCDQNPFTEPALNRAFAPPEGGSGSSLESTAMGKGSLGFFMVAVLHQLGQGRQIQLYL